LFEAYYLLNEVHLVLPCRLFSFLKLVNLPHTKRKSICLLLSLSSMLVQRASWADNFLLGLKE